METLYVVLHDPKNDRYLKFDGQNQPAVTTLLQGYGWSFDYTDYSTFTTLIANRNIPEA